MDDPFPEQPRDTGAPQPRGLRDAPLAMDSEEFRRLGHALVDSLAGFLASIPGRPVATGESPGVIRALIDAERPLPATGARAEALLQSASELLFNHSLFN